MTTTTHNQGHNAGPGGRDAVQGALFGDPALIDGGGERTTIGTQDPADVARIVRAAEDPGLLLVERNSLVLQSDPARPGCAEPLARSEGDIAVQLLDAGHLRLGGRHHTHYSGEEGPARSLLVPKATRTMVTRWGNLRPLAEQRPAREPAPAADKSGRCGVIGVDVVRPGRALVTLTGTGRGGEILRESGRYRVENDHGSLVGHAASYSAGGRLLARYHGYTPGPVEIDHEHRGQG